MVANEAEPVQQYPMWREHPGSQVVWAVAGAVMVVISLLSWFVLKHIDEPVRRRLKVRTGAAAIA
jgi:peptidoglycan/LPS O-acetylase OafA/YrhL